MTVFVDTSAWFALLAADDANNASARRTFSELAVRRDRLVTHNYVVVESIALMSSRLSRSDVARFIVDLLPTSEIEWIQPSLHEVAVASFLDAGGSASFVDHVSFALIRARGITSTFAYDRDFVRQGFQLLH